MNCCQRILLVAVLPMLVAPPSLAESQRAKEMKRAKELTERADENRPDAQLTYYLMERPLIVGGQIEFESRYRGDFRLDSARPDDEARLRPEVELELFYALTRDVSLYVEGKLGYESGVYHEARDEESEWQLRRGEMWLHWRDVGETGLSFQVGRQAFKDRREWWWDADLDAVRLTYDIADFELQFAVAQELGPDQANRSRVRPDLEDVLFLLGRGTWYWGKKNRLELFFAHRDDHSRTERVGQVVPRERRDAMDADLWWVGARALGRLKTNSLGSFHYWLDAAHVRGDETIIDYDRLATAPEKLSEVDTAPNFDVSGWGIDVGATWDPRRRFVPRLTLGYAWGSGGGSLGSGDRSFRQTGLQDNNAKFRGVDRFKYYGELFRPDLSNMHITTISLGVPILRNSSIELLYHVYWQDHASAFLRESRLQASPQGEHRSLGQEWDLVIGLEEWTHWEVEIIGSLFRAGSAFGPLQRRRSHLGLVKLKYNF